MKFILFSIQLVWTFSVIGQPYSSSSIFAHNDYATPRPFYTAYENQVGFIEADVFLVDNNLRVAHTEKELAQAKTLQELYLTPLKQKILENNGFAYTDREKMLTLMIDLKTEASVTLPALINIVSTYPELIHSKNFRIAISGNMPAPHTWSQYPSWLYFDGRPAINYTPDQLQRVVMISTSMAALTNWNGKGVLVKEHYERVKDVVSKAHAVGKPVRFWGAPDFISAWMKLISLVKADIINTDHVEACVQFFKNREFTTYQGEVSHTAYVPAPKVKWKKTPQNIILLIGDGTGLAQLYSGYTANHGSLSIFNIPTVGLCVTASANNYITDSAAGATALATGTLTNNRYIGVDANGQPVATLVEILRQQNYHTALITSDDVTGATPASFYAHQPERGMSEPIANDFLKSKVDILIGGGMKNFSERKDNRNLLDTLKKQGYTVATRFAALDTITNSRFVILDNETVLPIQKGRGEILSRSLNKSLQVFSGKGKKFFIMVEGAQIDWGGHANNLGYIVTEVLDFDKTAAEAMKFVDADDDTLLIITADHETGGLSLIDGDLKTGFVQGAFSTTDHSGIPVPVFAYGPGSEYFKGVYLNTAIFVKIKQLLNKK
ncbi:MAG: alkaline phosphatase [Cyclobacteriaceae bacterium]|nr:alkaline phosphatase [Cyclobacteriaceae bacterium]